MVLSAILKDSDYRLTQFSPKKIESLQSEVTEKTGKFFVTCLARKKEVRLTPEEVIRQLYIMTLTDDFGYPLSFTAGYVVFPKGLSCVWQVKKPVKKYYVFN